ncbi:lipase precursor, putative [Talaromyces stipitatus ATCC 10500]|uniref:Lipase, putative n=1 Tax=Talaromyces stipitatus (strain ATCC 10500 / CBS 375.48 / QM 6759 / NRRL 1006) TaxID=441959 RepID=B8LXP7_TALSN|nr:lipase precursor, putative [Talaromyces stipitatus ATCC 10500]EED24548.1 lipase precursor, putative [Talaromyces stipitatus ATCC 10500]
MMMLLKLITAVAAFTATASAGLIQRGDAAADAINTTTLATLNLYEQYSAAAYCTRNTIASPGTLITCAAGNCPLVETNGATIAYSFKDIGVGDVSGFLAVDPTNSLLVLAFAGIRDIAGWITKLNDRLVPSTTVCGTTANCTVHQGFLNSWSSVSGIIVPQIINASATTGFTTLVLTGHGFGGALAALATAQFRTTPIGNIAITTLLTYGSPRVGNTAFATYLTTTNATTFNFRVTHTDDPVPKFPSRALGYLQWGPEYWIRSPTGAPVRTFDVDQINGTETSTGNSGTPFSLDFPAHFWYFNAIAACK